MVEEIIKEVSINVDKLKVFANTNSKGNTTYSWEIQLVGIDLDRMKKLNDEMLKEYGSKNVQGLI